MWQGSVRFRNEPGITVSAYALLMFAFAIIQLPVRYVPIPYSARLVIPFVLVTLGLIVLRRVRAAESLAYVLIASVCLVAVLIVAACFTALTGYTFSKYNPHVVPRSAALGYLYMALVAVPVTIFSAKFYQNRLREIDG
jgi:hypothetical protein